MSVAVDTTLTAEFDIEAIGLGTDTLASVSQDLQTNSTSNDDRIVGDMRVRQIGDVDVMFFNAREARDLVVTICGFRRPDPTNPTEKVMRLAGVDASLLKPMGSEL